MKVSTEDLLSLRSAEKGSELVVLEGRTMVRTPGAAEESNHAGALTVLSREDLLAEMGEDGWTDRGMAELAARLNTEITNRGG